MKAIIKPLIITLVVAGAGFGGVKLLAGNKAKSDKDKVTYNTDKVTQGDVRSSVTATGVVQPWKIIDVKSNVAGKIDRLYVDLGDTVKSGQLIADINRVDTNTAFEQASADLDAAEARRQQALSSVRQQEIQAESRIASAEKGVQSAKARLAEAKARLAEAKANQDVQPDLTDLSIAQAKAAKVSAEKSVRQAEDSKKQLMEQLSQLKDVTIPLNIRTADANVNQASANVLTAQADYRRQRELLSQGYVAMGDVQDAYARLATSKAALDTSKQRQNTIKRENEISIRELQARIDGAQSTIEEGTARVAQAEASLRLAEKNGVQIEVRKYTFNAAEAAVSQAEAAVKQAEAELRGAQAEKQLIKVRNEDVTTAKTQIVRAKAAKTQAQQNLDFTRIVAPRDGIVITKNVEEGTVVPSSRASIGSTNAMLQIGDVTKLWIVCNVDETDIGQVKEKQKVTIKVDAFPTMELTGKVIRIDPQAKVEQNVTLIPVTVELDKGDDPRVSLVRPGMNATCDFVVDEAKNVLLVPNEALKEEGEGAYYVEVMENGVPKKVEVSVGIAGTDFTEIREGLKADEEVVTKTIQPEKAEANNPFNPFGGMGRGGRGGGGGARGGGGGGRGGR